MKGLSEQELENALRKAPRPQAPAGVKAQLIAQMRSTGLKPSRPVVTLAVQRQGWLRRWWPALAAFGLSCACAVVMAVQWKEIRELKQSIPTLSTNAAPQTPARASKTSDSQSADAAATQQEIARLKDEVASLMAEISGLQKTQSENQTLRGQLAAPAPVAGLTAQELADLEKARQKAMMIQCVNNMKQMGLAVRIWAGDHNDAFPPDIISMSNELNTTRILVCPADTNRQAASDWASYTDANCSYEYLGGSETEVERVMFRCPIHGTIGLCDGSVQQIGPPGKHPDWLIQRNGKLYFEPPNRR
jgi:hypothetical protein